jgi:hypothetical protein
MPGGEEIRDLIVGVAEGATGGVAALAASGLGGSVESFDVEVTLDGSGGQDPALRAVICFTIAVASDTAAMQRIVA